MISFLKAKLRPFILWFSSAAYRKYVMLLLTKKKQGVTAFCGQDFYYIDAVSTAWQIRDIFVKEIYRFETTAKNPVIVDCGSNVGVSALYFLRHYPGANLTLIEAHPKIAELITKNISPYPKSRVRVLSAAAWIHDQGVSFAIEDADGSSMDGSGPKVSVASIRVKDLLTQHASIDLLKIDIEGAEYEVLKDCAEELHRVKRLFVEYHSLKTEPQKLAELLMILRNAGFRVYCETIRERAQPLIHTSPDGPFDLQMNLFATRSIATF